MHEKNQSSNTTSNIYTLCVEYIFLTLTRLNLNRSDSIRFNAFFFISMNPFNDYHYYYCYSSLYKEMFKHHWRRLVTIWASANRQPFSHPDNFCLDFPSMAINEKWTKIYLDTISFLVLILSNSSFSKWKMENGKLETKST